MDSNPSNGNENWVTNWKRIESTSFRKIHLLKSQPLSTFQEKEWNKKIFWNFTIPVLSWPYLVTTVLPILITTLLAFFNSDLEAKAFLCLSKLLRWTKAEDSETPYVKGENNIKMILSWFGFKLNNIKHLQLTSYSPLPYLNFSVACQKIHFHFFCCKRNLIHSYVFMVYTLILSNLVNRISKEIN